MRDNEASGLSVSMFILGVLMVIVFVFAALVIDGKLPAVTETIKGWLN